MRKKQRSVYIIILCLLAWALSWGNTPCPGAAGENEEASGLQNGTDAHPTKNKISLRSAGKDKFAPKQLLVRFRNGISQNNVRDMLTARAVKVQSYRPGGDYCVLTLPDTLPVPEATAWLETQETVEYAEPNYLLHTQEIPNDYEYGDQWSLVNIHAEPAWDLEVGRPEVVIAVIDTGVDYNHPDLSANIWQNPGEIPDNRIDDDGNGFTDDVMGWDFVAYADDCATTEDCTVRDNDPVDVHGHGTHVAGIAAAVTNNGDGIAGVAWNCPIMALRAGYKDSSGKGSLKLDDTAQAIYYAVDNGARVLNLSWGGTTNYRTLETAVQYAANRGVIICAAAGNNNSSAPFYPAAYTDPAVLAVGATTASELKASYSNFGAWVDVSAPGDVILSTWVGGAYVTKRGTSMAAPHVAGLTALLFSRFPGWSSPVIKDMILESVTVIDDLAPYNAVSGIINMTNALEVDDGDMARFTEILSDYFGHTGCDAGVFCEGDMDGDGDVDGTDLAILLTY